ncbi:MAG: type II secretion system minor pseudopilin GspI [Rubrivivax sp.]|nr:type II secretion system minor pseudopilin GspI [Rubrivivax sp.]
MRRRPTPSTAGLARGHRGFTLIEVMVALAIVAIALGAGLRAAGTLTDNAARLEGVLTAQWCADNALTNLRLARQLPGIGESEFTCTQLGHEFAGRLLTQPTPNPNFRRVDASVRDASGATLVTLSTVLGRF